MRLKQYITEFKGKEKKKGFQYTTTQDKTGHSHKAVTNADGNGATYSTIGDSPDHKHKIVDWNIQPAKGHIHKLNTK